MARTLDQVLAELGTTYDPQIASVRQRQELLPQQVADEEKQLIAKQGQAFDTILGGARQRGLGFSGIPLAEQAKYTSTEFLPALARSKQQAREQAMSLEDVILGIQERRRTQGQSIFEGERNFEEQQRQFNEQLKMSQQAAKAASGGGFSFGGAAPAVQGATAPAAISNFKNGKDGSGGFFFKDASGKPISAATYAQATGKQFGQLLYEMGRAGDKYAQQAYNQIKANQAYYNANPAALRSEFRYLF